MPRLLLFRHAKAENTPRGGTDHDRTLTKSGRKDSAAMGAALAQHGPVDLVLCSDAARAKETWEASRAALGASPEVRLLRAIYDADDYLPILQAEGGGARTVLLVGHNPTMHDTAAALVSDLRTPDGVILASRFPKAALAVLDLEGNWTDLGQGRARLAAFVLPKYG